MEHTSSLTFAIDQRRVMLNWVVTHLNNFRFENGSTYFTKEASVKKNWIDAAIKHNENAKDVTVQKNNSEIVWGYIKATGEWQNLHDLKGSVILTKSGEMACEALDDFVMAAESNNWLTKSHGRKIQTRVEKFGQRASYSFNFVGASDEKLEPDDVKQECNNAERKVEDQILMIYAASASCDPLITDTIRIMLNSRPTLRKCIYEMACAVREL
jgi:hypothetical protein